MMVGNNVTQYISFNILFYFFKRERERERKCLLVQQI